MLIGITSGISFARFFLYLLPVAFLSTIILILVIYWFYNRSFNHNFDGPPDPPAGRQPYDIKVMVRLVPVLVLLIAAFFFSSYIEMGMPLIALSCAALVLLLGRATPTEVLKGVDWVLLLFFAGLFIVIGGAHKAGVLDLFTDRVIATPDMSSIVSISLISTLVSQVVSNVPLTMLLLPTLKAVPGDALWITLAAGSTLGGNLTIIGAVANIIVVEGASREGVNIGFVEFLKVGAMVTVLTVGLAILILGAEYWTGWLR
jgi:Na+/H+ antiporter NhaD/arsenite permease-like protein